MRGGTSGTRWLVGASIVCALCFRDANGFRGQAFVLQHGHEHPDGKDKLEWSVTAAQAEKFVAAIGGENALVSAIKYLQHHARDDGFHCAREELVAMLQRHVQNHASLRSLEVVSNQFFELEQFMRNHSDIKKLFDWARSPEGEVELRHRVGFTSCDYRVIKSKISSVAPLSFGYEDREFDFTWRPADVSKVSVHMGAQLNGLMAVDVGTFVTSCEPDLGLRAVSFTRVKTSDHRTVLAATFVEKMKNRSFPILQPWFIDGTEITFFGRQGKEVWQYSTDLVLPLRVSQRSSRRNQGALPGAAAFTMSMFHSQPVLRLSKVFGAHNGDMILVPWCAGASHVHTLREWLSKLGMVPLSY